MSTCECRCRRSCDRGAAGGGPQGLSARALERAAAGREGARRGRRVRRGRSRRRELHPRRPARLEPRVDRPADRGGARGARCGCRARPPLLAAARQRARPACARALAQPPTADEHRRATQGPSGTRSLEGHRRAREPEPAGARARSRARARLPHATGGRSQPSGRHHPGPCRHRGPAHSIPARLRHHRRRHLSRLLPTGKARRRRQARHRGRRRHHAQDGSSRRQQADLDDAPDRVERRHRHRAAPRQRAALPHPEPGAVHGLPGDRERSSRAGLLRRASHADRAPRRREGGLELDVLGARAPAAARGAHV